MGKVKKTQTDQDQNQEMEENEAGYEGEGEDEGEEEEGSTPEGFRRLSANREARWWYVSPGRTIQGVLLGRFQKNESDEDKKKGTRRHYYQVRITVPCEVSLTDPVTKERRSEPCPVGSIVNIDEYMDITVLSGLVTEENKAYEIWIRAVEKVRSKKNAAHMFWRFECASKQVELSELDHIPF